MTTLTPPVTQRRHPLLALGELLLGNLDMTRNITKGFDTYGDVYQVEFKRQASYIIRHPNHIQQVLVTDAAKYHKDPDYSDPNTGLARYLGYGLLTSDGEFWKRQRKLILPAFHHKRIEGYADIMTAHALKQSAGWQDGDTVGVADAMMHLTMSIVVEALFQSDMTSDANNIGNALDVMQQHFIQMALVPAWLPTPAGLSAPKAVKAMDDVVYRLIADWRRTGEDRGDLLSMLMLVQDEDGTHMTDKQVRDEALTLILAGHETTANVLNWTWYLLSQHPEVESKLHDELDRVLHGRTPTYQDLRELPYTDMIIKEAMRLYPPAYFIGRMAIEDTTLGDYVVPKGTQVSIATFAAHRDPRWWKNPDAFIPERWAEKDDRPKHAYLPFGAGPRVCIGNTFASLEARILLATLAQKFRLQLPQGAVVKTDPLITLRPKGPLKMRVSLRTPEPSVAMPG